MNYLVMGALTAAAGVLLVLRHLHMWRKQTDATEDPKQKSFYWSQFRRRTITSSAIALLGVVIGLFHFREYWRDHPINWVILVCCALLLVLVIFVLGVLDLIAVGQAIRVERVSSGEAARELAKEYHRLKKKAADESSESSTNNDSGGSG